MSRGFVSEAHIAAWRAHVLDGHICDEDHLTMVLALCDEVVRLRDTLARVDALVRHDDWHAEGERKLRDDVRAALAPPRGLR